MEIVRISRNTLWLTPLKQNERECMKLRSTFYLLLLGCILLAIPEPGFGQSKPHRIVISVTSSDEADWKLALGNIRNAIAGYAPDSPEIEVVVFGPGLKLVVNPSTLDPEIQALEAKHVRFVACQNTMRFEHLALTDLVKGFQSVPSGIIEVVSKQEEGWSYIKGGR